MKRQTDGFSMEEARRDRRNWQRRQGSIQQEQNRRFEEERANRERRKAERRQQKLDEKKNRQVPFKAVFVLDADECPVQHEEAAANIRRIAAHLGITNLNLSIVEALMKGQYDWAKVQAAKLKEAA